MFNEKRPKLRPKKHFRPEWLMRLKWPQYGDFVAHDVYVEDFFDDDMVIHTDGTLTGVSFKGCTGTRGGRV